MIPDGTVPVVEDPADPEQHLQQLQRMAMLGTLASGIGHDLRNLVMPMMLRLDVLTASTDIPARARGELSSIRDIVLQLQRLAGGLRLLSSDPYDQRGENQVTALAEWWREVHGVVVDALTPTTLLEAEFQPDLPSVYMPPDVLAQVVVNIVMNARRAMQDTPAPRLGISTRVSGNCVYLDISDNGRGMDEETRRRCFEPFFTTQVREFATGLGLSTGRALLKRYGGDLTLSADDGPGATFTVHLPIRSSQSTSQRSSRRRVELSVREPRLRALLRLMVANRGFELVTSNANPANGETPDYVICDAHSLGEIVRRRREIVEQAGNRDATGDVAVDTIGHGYQIIAIGDPQSNADGQGILWVDAQDLARLTDILE